MSSRRRSRSRDKKNSNPKLRMDTKPQTMRISDPSNPVGRRKEIDNVMKKARAAQRSPTTGAIWNKKLLEVEAKDPNRWTHSGYKSLYIDGDSSPSSQSPPVRRSRSRSLHRRSALASARSPSPPVAMSSRRRSPPHAMSGARRSPPPVTRGMRSSPRRSGIRSPSSHYRSPVRTRSPVMRGRPRSPPPRRTPNSPPVRRRSPSGSSLSSCSDESCSVCSPKTRRPRSPRSPRSRSISPPPKMVATSKRHIKRPPSPKTPVRRRPPSPSPSPPPPRRMPRPMTPPVAKKIPKISASDRPTDPRRQPPPPRPRGATGELISIKGVKPNQKPGQPKMMKIKQEKKAKMVRETAGDSSGSEELPPAPVIVVPVVATTGVMLSERFGKIAQWTADRERRDMENMRITKTGSNMKVMVEEEDYLYGTPPRRYSMSPGPAGRFPDELLASGPSNLASWDDVRVRYQYYKDLGYLRDLSIDDYMKWEEWWYKYQDWLANERHYEHWLATQGAGGGGRRRRKKPIQSRLN